MRSVICSLAFLSFLLAGCAMSSKVDRGGFSLMVKIYDEEEVHE